MQSSSLSAASKEQGEIELSELEQKIFKTMLDTVRDGNLDVTLRCAGGWVRDKLLGKESLDIDIALDTMMGKDFAERVNAYLQSKGEATKSIGVIVSNPEQSKHLETARMMVHDIWVDLVNLRSETYAEGSRIPTVEFGTPKQDAERRDFTINSMFYNINQGLVEDFTGRGKEDLKAGLLRTPLQAKETFLDDPLRVLRAIRFAARFSFKLDEELVEAAASREVREALHDKVSRERVGIEVEGMLKGPAPVDAFRLIQDLCIFPEVFLLGAKDLAGPNPGDPCVAVAAAAWEVLQEVNMEPDKSRLALLAALLLPLRSGRTPGKKPVPLGGYVIREALKGKAKDAEQVVALHEDAAVLQRVLLGLQGAPEAEAAGDDVRLALGGALRRLKGLWRAGAVVSTLVTMPEAAPLGADGHRGESPGSSGDPSSPSAREGGADTRARVGSYRQLEAAVAAFGLEECWSWKPPLAGGEVMQALGVKKGGPAVGAVVAAVTDWQLIHPKGTREECLAWLPDTLAAVNEWLKTHPKGSKEQCLQWLRQTGRLKSQSGSRGGY